MPQEVTVILVIVIVLAVLFVLCGLRLEQEYQRGVIFRLGRFSSVKGPGLYWIIPIIDRRVRVDIRTRTVDIESQETITSDSVTIKVNAVPYYRIAEPDKAIIQVADYNHACY